LKGLFQQITAFSNNSEKIAGADSKMPGGTAQPLGIKLRGHDEKALPYRSL
jgi:hypothetical protein